MLVKLKLIFEERFRYDDEGVPRVWKPDDDIDTIFKKAKDAVSFSILIPQLLGTCSLTFPHNHRYSLLSHYIHESLQ